MPILNTSRKRIALFFLLYLAEGAPIGLIWWTLPTLLKTQNFSIEFITALVATVTLPWSLKFLIGPFVDLFAGNVRKLKLWIFCHQMGMGLSLIPLFSAISSQNENVLFFSLVLHAFFAASQDVGIDTLAIRTLPKNELGKANGWMQAGMLFGRALIGGAGLWIAHTYSIQWTLGLVVGMIFISSIAVFGFHGETQHIPQKKSFKDYFSNLKNLITQKRVLLGLGLAFFTGFSFEGIGVVAGPIQKDFGISIESISLFFGILSPTALTLGAIFGGIQSDKMGHLKGLKRSILLMSACVFTLAASIQLELTYFLPWALGAIYFCIGWLTANLYAYLMDQTEPSFAALEFSAFMAMTNLSESASGFLIGKAKGSLGYPIGFLGLLMISWISFYFLKLQSSSFSNPESS